MRKKETNYDIQSEIKNQDINMFLVGHYLHLVYTSDSADTTDTAGFF